MNDARKQAMRKYAIEHAKWEQWTQIFETRDCVELANLMLVLILQAKYLLELLHVVSPKVVNIFPWMR